MTTEPTSTRRTTQTKIPDTTINEAAQDTINIILWGASGTALLILLIRLVISGIHHCRRRNQANLALNNGNRSTCALQEEPPPNYSELSMRSLPPTYSQGCTILHYHPSTGNTSQQTQSTTEDDITRVYRTDSYENDFIAPPSSSYENNNDISNTDGHQTITDAFPNSENDGNVLSISNANIMDVNNSALSTNSTGRRIFDIDFMLSPIEFEETENANNITNIQGRGRNRNSQSECNMPSSLTNSRHSRSEADISLSYANQSFENGPTAIAHR